jgi:hypothetical protein
MRIHNPLEVMSMDTIHADFDCRSILQMMQETPEVAAVIIDMIAGLEEVDANCLNMIRELQVMNTVAA